MSEFTLIELAVLLLAPLVMMATFLLGYLDWILGKSAPSSGDLEHLIEKKNAEGFTRLARRIRPSQKYVTHEVRTDSSDDLARLARSTHQA